MNNDIITFSWLYIPIAIVGSIFAASKLERRLKACLPATRPYRWGYYVGCMGVACAPLAALAAIAALATGTKGGWEDVGYFLGLAFFFALHAVCGWFIIHRKQWAW